ncbi:coiled-coil-helix-coiled-coil-helix domain-containing protein 10, mitochondrial [Halyomorpha halys]|uniref:coiled-coil-helix-coiled-coil-helix domain-containing protein 10, mitochondrial n=1 Tax=Halyomorpha halys TaxID=286706 RepID=UPI0006D51E3E|nr:coiled-coil-helix-coiled-coil-helix domain-containing protein 10, mitochondrial-like [Halyomorpha halys]
MRRGGGRGGGRGFSPPRRYSTPPRPPPPPPPPPQRQAPGLFKQMAATAAGVAVGSAVGHAVGAGVTGMFSGGGNDVHAAREQYGATEPTGPCAHEIKQFLKCAETQADISICAGFNEAIKNCKKQYNLE